MENNNFKNGIIGGILSPDLPLENKEKVISTVICNKIASADVGGEFTLPEHMPDIRKLVKVEVRPSPASEFLSGGGIQMGGGIEYIAVYLGSDGCVYSASFPGEYNFSIPFDEGSAGGTEGAYTFSNVSPESAVSRVSSPRRINVRCRLAAKATVLKPKALECGASVPNEDHIQKLCKKTPFFTELRGCKDDVELVDSVDTSEEGVRYLYSDCKVFVEDAVSGDGYADCRGYALSKHFMCGENGEFYTVSNKIPFSEAVEIDGLSAGSLVCVSGACSDIGVNMQEIDTEADGKMRLVIRIKLDAAAFNEGELEYVKDVYSTDCECSPECETNRLPLLLACKNGNMTFSGSEDFSAMGISGEIVNVIDVSAGARCESVTCENNKCVVNGKCRFGMICMGENTEDIGYSECELPFRYEFDGISGEVSRYECSIVASEPRVRRDGDKISFDCELSVSCFALGEGEAKTVSAVKMECMAKKEKRGFTVCYPDKNDSLWSVAKRYRASVLNTARSNGMSDVADADDIRLPDGKKYMIV